MLAATPPDTARPARPAIHPLFALADQCVQCGLCLPHCPTYQLDRSEAESPRGRIAYMKAVTVGSLPPTAAGDRHLDHCLGCRRCEAVCPAGVHYGELLIGARTEQFQRQAPKTPTRLTLWLLAQPRLLALALAGYRLAFPLLPTSLRRLPRPPEPSTLAPNSSGAGKSALFLGCIARGYESSTAAALQRLLDAVGLDLSVPAQQTCCGAAAEHAGDAAATSKLATGNRRAFSGQTQVLCLASGCRERLGAALAGQSEVRDPLDLLAEQLPRLRFRASTRRVALHLPCSQRSGPAMRRLLAAIPGLTVLSLPERGCCGAAGLHMLAEPDRAAALRAPLLASLSELQVDELLSANIGCRLHLANAAAIPVRHPLDFLAEHLP